MTDFCAAIWVTIGILLLAGMLSKSGVKFTIDGQQHTVQLGWDR